jgi:ElaB/YqjD/DUF883 family membrane-anchored ribosome-binding protein
MSESTNGAQGGASGAQEQIRESASGVADTVREKAREQIDQRSSQAGEQVGSLAGDLKQLSEQLREQGNDGPAKVGEQAAQRAERLGSYLSESDSDKILRDAENLGRERPWIALAGGILIGVAAARALKASSTDRYRSSQNGASQTPSGSNGAERHDVPPPVGNLTETVPVSYGDTATAQAAAEDLVDQPAATPPGARTAG